MRFYLIILICSLRITVNSQTENYDIKPPRNYETNPAKNAWFAEIGGNAGLFSLNFDRIYYYKVNFKLSGRFGVSVNMNNIYFEPIAVIEQNFIFLKNPHHIELGIGTTLQRRYNEKINKTNDYAWENILFGTTRIGYRYQKQDDGLFLRAAITPITTSKDALGFHPNYFQFWAGVSVGMSF